MHCRIIHCAEGILSHVTRTCSDSPSLIDVPILLTMSAAAPLLLAGATTGCTAGFADAAFVVSAARSADAGTELLREVFTSIAASRDSSFGAEYTLMPPPYMNNETTAKHQDTSSISRMILMHV